MGACVSMQDAQSMDTTLETHHPVNTTEIDLVEEQKQQSFDKLTKGQWMEYTVTGTANDEKLAMKTTEHDIAEGLNPMEYLASSITSCLQVMIVLIASEMELTIGAISWTTTIAVDPKGAAGTPMTIALFADIEVDGDDQTASTVKEVFDAVERRCPLYALCKKVGLDLTLNYGVNGDKGAGLDDETSTDLELRQFVLKTVGKAMQSTITTADSRKVIADERETLGGTNTGANPMDYLGAAVQSALQMTLVEVAKEKELTVGAVEWSAVVGLDVEGLMGVEGAVVNPQSITLEASVEIEGLDQNGLEALGKEVEDRCDFYKMCRDSGVQMNVQYTLRQK